MGFELTRPVALILLPVVALLVLVDRRSRRAQARSRRYASLAIRALGFILLIVALANPLLWTGTDTLATVFLLDRSASVSAAEQQRAIAWIQQAIQAKRSGDLAGVISFAGDAAVEQGLSSTPTLLSPSADLDTSRTNLAGALRLAEGVLPLGGTRRIVLLSDGNENVGSALAEVPLLNAGGIQVDTVPIGGAVGPEVRVSRVSVPPAIHQGEQFTIDVTISSTVETAATVRFLVDQRLDSSRSLELHVGDNSLVFAHDPLPSGEHTIGVVVEPERDTLSENNVGYATLQVTGPSQVLLVEGRSGEARYLARALQSAGLSVDVEEPAILSGDVATLRRYSAIGLVNVPATVMSPDSLIALRSYVHDFGGGLVVVGGDQSFGAGAYRQTPLEDTLPVTMDVHGRQLRPPVAVALIVEDLEFSQGNDVAKSTAKAVVDQLTPQDEVAVSDANTGFPVPLRSAADPTAIDHAIDAMDTGDPSSYAPYLTEAARQLAASNAKIKHIILVGDGDARDNYQPLIQQIVGQGITVSTVATTTDPGGNPATMRAIADWGHGHYVEALDPFEVPRIVLQDTTEIARPAVTELTFVPSAVDQTPILNGITSLPPLAGYVATTAKASAVVGLSSPEQDPILAEWQYGLGRAVAFTSDASGGWSAAWVTWGEFSRFWGQTFKWTVPALPSGGLQVQTSVGDGQAHVVVDDTDSGGQAINDASLTATVAGPSGQVSSLPVPQVAPGEYAVDVATSAPGAYLVQVRQAGDSQTPASTQVAGFAVPYSPEFDGLPPDVGLLRKLARATGGAVLASPSESFAHDQRPADAARPLWPYLVGALVPLFVLDVAIRRLRISTTVLTRLVDRLRERWNGRTGRAAGLAAQLAATRRAARPLPAPPGRPPSPRAPVPAAPKPGNRLLAAKRRAPLAPRPASRSSTR